MADGFDNTDYFLLGTALAAIHADIETTKKLVAKGGAEKNPLLGSKPTNAVLNVSGLLSAGGTVALARHIPKKFRKGFLAGLTGFRGTLAQQNKKGKKFGNFKGALKRPIINAALSGILAHHTIGGDISIALSPGSSPKITITKKF